LVLVTVHAQLKSQAFVPNVAMSASVIRVMRMVFSSLVSRNIFSRSKNGNRYLLRCVRDPNDYSITYHLYRRYKNFGKYLKTVELTFHNLSQH